MEEERNPEETQVSNSVIGKSDVDKSTSWFRKSHITLLEAILFGYASALGNRFQGWHSDLKFGYDVTIINIFFAGSGFLCLCFCMSEMISALPFSGGIFGFVRATMGHFAGYLIGCFELIYLLTVITHKTSNVVSILKELDLLDTDFVITFIFILYGFSLVMNLIGGKPFWVFISLSGFLLFLLITIYLADVAAESSAGRVSHSTYCQGVYPLTMITFLQGRFKVNGQYNGLQYIPLLGKYLKDPRKEIPWAMLFCCGSFVFFSVILCTSACSQFPGVSELSKTSTPLKWGFSRVFHTSLDTGTWLHFPAFFCTLLCLIYCAGRQFEAIAKSTLIPSIFGYSLPITHSPYVGLLFTVCVSSGLNVWSIYWPDLTQEIYNIQTITWHVVFIGCFISYILFKTKYSSLPRYFTSPLGIGGAIYGILNYLLGWIGVVFFMEYSFMSTYVLCVAGGALSVLYWAILVRYQSYSEEEMKMMFKAYLINVNQANRLKKMKGVGVLRNFQGNSRADSKSRPSDNTTNLITNSQVRQASSVRSFMNSVHPAPPMQGTGAGIEMLSAESKHDQLSSSNENPQSTSAKAVSSKMDERSLRLSSNISSSLQYLSGKLKFNSISPTDTIVGSNSLSSKKFLEDQLVILSSGGLLEEQAVASLKVQLKAELGIDEENGLENNEDSAVNGEEAQ